MKSAFTQFGSIILIAVVAFGLAYASGVITINGKDIKGKKTV